MQRACTMQLQDAFVAIVAGDKAAQFGSHLHQRCQNDCDIALVGRDVLLQVTAGRGTEGERGRDASMNTGVASEAAGWSPPGGRSCRSSQKQARCLAASTQSPGFLCTR